MQFQWHLFGLQRRFMFSQIFTYPQKFPTSSFTLPPFFFFFSKLFFLFFSFFLFFQSSFFFSCFSSFVSFFFLFPQLSLPLLTLPSHHHSPHAITTTLKPPPPDSATHPHTAINLTPPHSLMPPHSLTPPISASFTLSFAQPPPQAADLLSIALVQPSHHPPHH